MTDGAIEGAFYTEMGKKLRCKRTERGWSRAALAKEVGCHRNTIERWEAGESISVWMLLRVCDILCCQHLLMLPSREYTWGGDYETVRRERDSWCKTVQGGASRCKAVQSERDPKLTMEEEMHLAGKRG